MPHTFMHVLVEKHPLPMRSVHVVASETDASRVVPQAAALDVVTEKTHF